MRKGSRLHKGTAVEARPGEVPRELMVAAVVPEGSSEPQATARPDFARGQERDPSRMDRFVIDRFSRGQETMITHEDVHEGTFATGQSALERHPERGLRGRFSRGQQETHEEASSAT
jgi:hypothetical protein